MSGMVLVPISQNRKRFVYEKQTAYPFTLIGGLVHAIRIEAARPVTGIILTPGAVIMSERKESG